MQAGLGEGPTHCGALTQNQDVDTLSGSLGQSGQLQALYRSLEFYLPLLGLEMKKGLDTSTLLGSDKGDPLVLGVLVSMVDCSYSGSHWGVALWLAVGLGRGHGWHSQQAQLAYAGPKCRAVGMIHSGTRGQLAKGWRRGAGAGVCPWSTSAFFFVFLENSRFWKVAWFSLPLKGVELGTMAAWQMTFILVACVRPWASSQQVPAFLMPKKRIIGIWRPPRIAEVEGSVLSLSRNKCP